MIGYGENPFDQLGETPEETVLNIISGSKKYLDWYKNIYEDQWFSGYPINWKQVGLSTVLGVAGGGIGYGAGKAFEWAAKTLF